jgi:integrase
MTDNLTENLVPHGRRVLGVSAAHAALTDADVKTIAPPSSGNRITYDATVKGFGVRVTSAGAKAFILNYRAAGRERRITIGSFPDWKTTAARDEAKAMKRRIDVGEDPMAERHANRAAATVNELADRFDAEHLAKRRPSTQVDYRSILRLYIRPTLGTMKVADVRHTDVDRMHAKIAKTAPYRANRTVAVLSKMMALAVKWEMRTDNPVIGIERAPEEKRERFLTPAEIARLSEALAAHPEKTSANVVRLLLLTGARRGETLAATWSQIDFAAGMWTKPAATTKQKKEHRVPLSAPALQLLSDMKAEADKENERRVRDKLEAITCLFPGMDGKPLTDIKHFWASICRTAGLAVQIEKKDDKGRTVTAVDDSPIIAWQPTVRLHDLRHTHASILASLGLSLPIIGRLLGHTQAATTQRYAHLMDDPLRAATERAGAVISGFGKGGADAAPTAVGNEKT